MKTTISQKIYLVSSKAIAIISFLFFLSLFLANFVWTCYCQDMTSQNVLTTKDMLVLNLVLFLPLLFVFLLLDRFFQKNAEGKSKILLRLTLAYVFLCGMLLFFFGRTVPAADSLSVYYCAKEVAFNNLGSIQPTGSYLSYYPQQIGLLAFWEILFRLFKLLPASVQYYHLLKIIYVLMTCGIVYYLFQITHRVFLRHETDCLFLLLCCLNAPLITYSSFLYSEIPSFLAFTFGLNSFLCLIREKQFCTPLTVAKFLLGMSLSVLLRKNSLILIIAVLIVLALHWLREGKQRSELLLICLATLALSLSILPAVTRLYEWRAGNTLSSGVPAMSYFAMGMQDTGRAAGWYNGFNFNTYAETGMDRAKTIELSKKAIAERWQYFMNNPSALVHFYGEKFLSQWADGTFACLQATLATYGGRSRFFQDIYEGKYSSAFVTYCNVYQLMTFWGGFFFAMIALFSSKGDLKICHYRNELSTFTLLIGAFGGFLFHMIWEANARYIFLYGLCLLPYCAEGLTLLSPELPRLIKKGKATSKGNK